MRIYKLLKTNTVWLVFVIFFLIEFYFFRSFLLNNIGSFYPTNFDQSSYLPLAYGTLEKVKHHGLVSGIINTPGLATGMLFPIQSVLFYWVFGASRLVSLLPNFIYFILLQWFSLMAVRRISKKTYLLFYLLSFIFSVNVPFLISGGWMDFRIDFMAFCLYGIFIACVVKSNLFLDFKWSVITALVAIFLMLFRFITTVYLLSVLWLMVFYFVLMVHVSYFKSDELSCNQKRLNHLIIITAFLTIIALCYVWLNQEVLYNYYMVGHFLGEEKNIRAKELGISNFFSVITFYPKYLFNGQLGQFWFKITLFSLLFQLIVLKIKMRSPISEMQLIKRSDLKRPSDIQWRGTLYFLLLSLFVPLIVLTMDVSKSTVVGSIMVMPILWIIMWGYLYLDSQSKLSKSTETLLTIFAVFLLLMSFLYHLIKLNHNKSAHEYEELGAITTMYLNIGDYARAHHWTEIRLSVDQICDYITSGGIETVYYETRGVLLPVAIEPVGGALFAITKKEVISSLDQSNVLIMNQQQYPAGSKIPFNQSITQFRPLLKSYAALQFKHLGDYQFMNSTYQVFVK